MRLICVCVTDEERGGDGVYVFYCWEAEVLSDAPAKGQSQRKKVGVIEGSTSYTLLYRFPYVI